MTYSEKLGHFNAGYSAYVDGDNRSPESKGLIGEALQEWNRGYQEASSDDSI